jgi:hypothetical protein
MVNLYLELLLLKMYNGILLLKNLLGDLKHR